jgi:hypothetical protein
VRTADTAPRCPNAFTNAISSSRGNPHFSGFKEKASEEGAAVFSTSKEGSSSDVRWVLESCTSVFIHCSTSAIVGNSFRKEKSGFLGCDWIVLVGRFGENEFIVLFFFWGFVLVTNSMTTTSTMLAAQGWDSNNQTDKLQEMTNTWCYSSN